MAEGQTDTDSSQQHPAWMSLITLSNVALVVFGLLVLTIIGIGIFSITKTPDAISQATDSFLITRTFAILLATAFICALFAWLSPANARVFGSGFAHILSINRAAVAAFAVAGSATVIICLFIAFTALFFGKIEHGLYILASIQFLLKFAAVSAIIVLITMRRPPTYVQLPASQSGEQSTPPIRDEGDERSRLEFGSLAFAFGLIVIAGLVIPNEDLMRLSAMFFGGDRTVEDYLPRRQLVTVDDELAIDIANSIVNSPELRRIMEEAGANESLVTDEIARLTTKMVASSVIDGVQVVGALPLLLSVCEEKEDEMIFPYSDDSLLGDHLSYLLTQGLIEYPYGDLRTLNVTIYGRDTLRNSGQPNNCVGLSSAFTEQEGRNAALALRNQLDTTADISKITEIPHHEEINIPANGATFELQLPEGAYTVRLDAVGSTDPILLLFDASGRLMGENDDSGLQGYSSRLSFDILPGQPLYIKALTFNGQAGRAVLRIDHHDASARDVASSQAALDILRTQTPVPLEQHAAVPPEGRAFVISPPTSARHLIDILPKPGHEDGDLIATLFRKNGTDYEELLEEDDTSNGNFPALMVELTSGETYYLVLRHYNGAAAGTVEVTINVLPPLLAEAPAEAPAAAETGTTDVPASPTGSSGSQPTAPPRPDPRE